MISKFLSRKFLVTIGGVVVIVALKLWGVPDSVIVWVGGIVLGFLGVEGGLDLAAILKGIKK